MLTLTDIKQQADILQDFLKQKNASISRSSCLQAIAKIHGYKDWNTLSATLKKQSSQLEKK